MLSIWPESEKLQIALAASSADGNNSRTAYSTFPRVKHELATTSELNVVSLNTETLLALINSGSLRDALYLTTKLLTNLGQGIGAPMQQAAAQNCPQSLEIWSCRFQLMMALKFHILLLDELLAFGELDAPDLYLQFHPKFGGTKGSMVPFSLRLVHAEAASFSSLPYQSVQRCLRLEANTKAVLEMLKRQNLQSNSPDIAIWQQRLEAVRTVQARVLFRLKEYEKSSIVYQQLLIDQANSAEKQRSILEALLKMAMHIGDAKAVEMYLAQLGNLCGRESVDFSVYSCFKSMFDGDYGTALATLQHLLKVQQPQLFTDPKFCNNEAICLLYNGRAMECMQQLYNHTGRVDDPLVHNLNTVSDLVSTNSQAFKQSYLAKQQQQQQQNGGSGAAMEAATAGETIRNDEVLDDGIQALKIV